MMRLSKRSSLNSFSWWCARSYHIKPISLTSAISENIRSSDYYQIYPQIDTKVNQIASATARIKIRASSQASSELSHLSDPLLFATSIQPFRPVRSSDPRGDLARASKAHSKPNWIRDPDDMARSDPTRARSPRELR